MSEYVVIGKMVTAGLMFGVWPLLMQRSGLQGLTSTAVLAVVIAVFVVPTALYSGMRFEGSMWQFAVAAGIASGIGLLTFNSGLAEATPATVGRLFVIMIVFQTATAAAYHAYMNGGLTLKTGAGFIAAAIAAFLLV